MSLWSERRSDLMRNPAQVDSLISVTYPLAGEFDM